MSRGISLIEMLVALGIVAMMLVGLFALFPKQLARSHDAERKRDLQKMKIALEEYYNDNGCYPTQPALETCGGTQLAPYLTETPCDPVTKNPYEYHPATDNACKGYRLLAALEDDSDPIITQLQCDGPCGCGLGPEYNYAVSSGVPINDGSCNPITPLPSGSASPSPSPSSSTAPGGGSPSPNPNPSTIYVYACDQSGQVCNKYAEGDPYLVNCPATFPTVSQCETACQSNPNAYKCTRSIQ